MITKKTKKKKKEEKEKKEKRKTKIMISMTIKQRLFLQCPYKLQ